MAAVQRARGGADNRAEGNSLLGESLVPLATTLEARKFARGPDTLLGTVAFKQILTVVVDRDLVWATNVHSAVLFGQGGPGPGGGVGNLGLEMAVVEQEAIGGAHGVEPCAVAGHPIDQFGSVPALLPGVDGAAVSVVQYQTPSETVNSAAVAISASCGGDCHLLPSGFSPTTCSSPMTCCQTSMARFAAHTEGLTNAEDELRLQERSRIATDLHDGLGQSLALISLTAGAAEDSRSVEDLQQALGDTAMIAREARDQMHEMANALAPLWAPDCLDSAGGPVPSRYMANVQEKLQAVDRELAVRDPDGLDQLPPASRDLCCRVLREGITIALRHASPGPIEIEVAETGSGLHLVISNHIPRSKREQPTVAVRRCTTVLARIAAEQGATLTAGPIDDRWQLELVLVGSRRIADPCAADAPLRVSWVRHDRAVGAPCVPVPRFELDLRNVPS